MANFHASKIKEFHPHTQQVDETWSLAKGTEHYLTQAVVGTANSPRSENSLSFYQGTGAFVTPPLF
jgi:hypothetical protein